MEINRLRSLTTISIFLIIPLLLLIVLYWASSRGFDLSDESFYIMGYYYAGNAPDLYPASFHIVFNRYFNHRDLSILEIRHLRLLGTILSCVPLYLGLKRLWAGSIKERRFIFLVLLMGSLLGYSWAPQTLSYNSMSSILFNIIVGFWFMVHGSKNIWGALFLFFIVGWLFSVLFFVKITNILLFPVLVLFSVYMSFFAKKRIVPKPKLWHMTIVLFAGLILSVAYLAGGFADSPIFLMDYWGQIMALQKNDPSHSFTFLLDKYYQNLEMVFTRLRAPLLIMTLLFIPTFFGGRRKIWPILVFKLTGIVVGLLFIYDGSCWLGGTKAVYIMILPYLYFFFFTLFCVWLNGNKIDYMALALVFLFIPLAGSFGTNNGLSAQVLFYASFILISIFYVVSKVYGDWFRWAVGCILFALVFSQVYHGVLLYPYRQAPLKEVNSKINRGPLEGMYVDQGLYELENSLDKLDFSKIEYVFSGSSIRGISLLMGKKPFSLDYFHLSHQEKLCYNFQRSLIPIEKVIFLVPLEHPLSAEVLDCFKTNGLDFNSDFTLTKDIPYFDYFYGNELRLGVYSYNKMR